MKTSIIIGSIAVLLATGQALADSAGPQTRQTLQQQIEEREALRRVAVADHQKRQEEFKRNCTRKDLSPAQLEACRAAYRKL
jgi:hypothetical protein